MDPTSIAALVSAVKPVVFNLPQIVDTVSTAAGAFSSGQGLIAQATGAAQALQFFSVAAPLAILAHSYVSVKEGRELRSLLDRHLTEISTDLKGIRESLDSMGRQNDPRVIAEHIFGFVDHHSRVASGPALLMVYHPGTDWHPRCATLSEQRAADIVAGRITRAAPVFMVFSSLEVLLVTAKLIRDEAKIPSTWPIHVLLPALQPLIIDTTLSLPRNLMPIEFYSETNRSGPLVWLSSRSTIGSTPIEMLTSHIGLQDFRLLAGDTGVTAGNERSGRKGEEEENKALEIAKKTAKIGAWTAAGVFSYGTVPAAYFGGKWVLSKIKKDKA